jgi:hypothetical protein
MSDDSNRPNASDAEMASIMFGQLVMQHSNMALIFLGQVPHPQTGQTSVDLEHARYFIDQLEMLAVKTRGNLDADEQALLNRSLTTLRIGFVEAASKKPGSAPTQEAKPSTEPPPTQPENAAPAAANPPAPPTGAAPSEESHKKFTKKY